MGKQIILDPWKIKKDFAQNSWPITDFFFLSAQFFRNKILRKYGVVGWLSNIGLAQLPSAASYHSFPAHAGPVLLDNYVILIYWMENSCELLPPSQTQRMINSPTNDRKQNGRQCPWRKANGLFAQMEQRNWPVEFSNAKLGKENTPWVPIWSRTI